jgi:alpha-beta hydrolase superfamily lysophospholipase
MVLQTRGRYFESSYRYRGQRCGKHELPIAQFILINFHVPVLLFDYRGFGSSDLFAYDSNAIAHPEYLTDFDAAIAYATIKAPGRKIIIYGRSMGASLALVEGSQPNGIIGVIAESPYICQDTLKARFEAFNPSVHITPIVSDKLEPYKHEADFRAKHLLLLHGRNEKFIVSDEMERYVKDLPIANKTFVDVPGCDHLELPQKAQQQFGDSLAMFLTACKE